MSNGEYEKIDFSRTAFQYSKWTNATCDECDFRGANFVFAKLENSLFLNCDFGPSGAGKDQIRTVLFDTLSSTIAKPGQQFSVCGFVGARFGGCTWNSIEFLGCNFAFADLGGVRIGTNVSIDASNLFGASNASPEFLIWAFNQPVTFTNITSQKQWDDVLGSKNLPYCQGCPEFVQWASNQWIAGEQSRRELHVKGGFYPPYTNSVVEAWLTWSSQNLTNN
jgi:hypothetical protein